MCYTWTYTSISQNPFTPTNLLKGNKSLFQASVTKNWKHYKNSISYFVRD